MTRPSLRIQEGALSALNTPTAPPAETKLVPIAEVVAGLSAANGTPAVARPESSLRHTNEHS